MRKIKLRSPRRKAIGGFRENAVIAANGKVSGIMQSSHFQPCLRRLPAYSRGYQPSSSTATSVNINVMHFLTEGRKSIVASCQMRRVCRRGPFLTIRTSPAVSPPGVDDIANLDHIPRLSSGLAMLVSVTKHQQRRQRQPRDFAT